MCSVARLSRMPVLPDKDCLRSFGDLGRECVLDLNAGEMYTPVWTAWMWFGDDSSRAAVSSLLWGGVALCHSRAGARGCADNGHSPGETQVARKVDFSPGEMCAAEPGYLRPVLVAGPPAHAWVVTGLLLFGSPPSRVRGCLRPPLLSQLQFDVPAVFRCACVIASGAQCERCPSRYSRTLDTLTESRLCRLCSLPPRDPTWIVLVVIWLSCRLVWWNIMSSGTLPMGDWASASPTPSAPLPGTF